MKLSATQENLNKALSVVSRILPSRPSLPILNNLLLKTEAAQLSIIATNLELALIYTIGAKIEKTGTVSVPGRLITELIASLDKDTIQLISSDSNLIIKTTNLDSLLNGSNIEDFPVIPKNKPDLSIDVDSQSFKNSLSEVIVAAAIDEARPVLNGVLFDFNDNKLTLAATDSYRLAQSSIKIKNTKKFTVIVPVRTAQELIRLLSGEEPIIKIEVSTTEAVFTYGQAKLISRLIEGKYPNYKQIFPDKSTTQIVVDKDVILQAVKVSALFARESANTIKLSVSKDKLAISTNTSEIGQNNSEVEAKITGSPIDIQLNSRYILNSLNVVSTPIVVIELTGELNPCIIKPKSSSKQNAESIHVIMPLRN